MRKRYEQQNGFYQIQNDIFKNGLDPYSFMIYSYLVSCAGQNGECWPSIPTMSRYLGMSQATIQKRIKNLSEKKFIEVIHKREITGDGFARTANNHYQIRDFDDAWFHMVNEHKREQKNQDYTMNDDLPF